MYTLGCKQLAAVASRLGSAPGHSCRIYFVTTCILLVDARLNIKTYSSRIHNSSDTNKHLLSPILKSYFYNCCQSEIN